MPLYMDLHKASDYEIKPTVEDIKRNHIADLAVQHKYGVRFLQYWINEEAGMVFCLMEAPNKEACAAVHAEAHGAMPCNVIELQGGDYAAFLHDGTRKNSFDIVEKSDGTLDSGYRTVMVVDVLSLVTGKPVGQPVHDIITGHGGRLLQRPGHRLSVLFTSASQAIECAHAIVQQVASGFEPGTEIRVGISAGAPLTEGQELFGDAIQLANRLCDVALHGQVVLSAMAKELAGKCNGHQHEGASLKTLEPEQEQWLNRLLEASTSLLAAHSLHIDSLAKALGMSRSQLYRKTKELTGSSPNGFIQEQRLQKAVQLIREQYGNVTQVAMEAGFSHLSYFARLFQQRFGIPPFKASRFHA